MEKLVSVNSTFSYAKVEQTTSFFNTPGTKDTALNILYFNYQVLLTIFNYSSVIGDI